MSVAKRLREAAICIGLLALPFLVLKSNLKDPSRVNAFDRAVLGASAPLQALGMRLARGLSAIVQEYTMLIDVRRENDRLRSENARLRDELARFEQTAAENISLRELLEFRQEAPVETISAQVIAKNVSLGHFRITRFVLDRGDRTRVRPGMPVIAPGGLVGQVSRVWGDYCDVLLVADAQSNVDVVVERNGARGILRGTGDPQGYLCRTAYLALNDEVRVGDIVTTSGYGQRFIAGIPVGRVTNVMRASQGLFQQVEVTPLVDFSNLESVLIVTSDARERWRGVHSNTPPTRVP